jgi:hypothetical protein
MFAMRKIGIFGYFVFSILLSWLTYRSSGAQDGLAILQEFPLPKSDLNFLFDGANRALYGGDRSSQTVYRIELEAGTTKTVTFTNTPQSLALSPDGAHLFVALWLHLPNSSTAENQSGIIAEIDARSFTETRRFPTQIDAFHMVVPSTDKIVVSSLSGNLTYIDTYDLKTGARLGSAAELIFAASWLIPQPPLPSGRVYAWGGGFLHRLEVDSASGAYLQPFSLQPLSMPATSGVWTDPEGKLMIAGSGQVFQISEGATNDLRLAGLLGQDNLSPGVSSVAFAPELHAIFGAWRALSSKLLYFQSESFELNAAYDVPLIEGIFAYQGELWGVFQTEANMPVLRRMANPAIGADRNTPPVASFTVSPPKSYDDQRCHP